MFYEKIISNLSCNQDSLKNYF